MFTLILNNTIKVEFITRSGYLDCYVNNRWIWYTCAAFNDIKEVCEYFLSNYFQYNGDVFEIEPTVYGVEIPANIFYQSPLRTLRMPDIRWYTSNTNIGLNNYTFDCNYPIRQEATMPASRFPRRKYLTLMPYHSYKKTAECLSDKDLKQMRVVVLRLLRISDCVPSYINGAKRKSIDLWVGYKQSLIRYGIYVALELKKRGYKDKSLEELQSQYLEGDCSKPPWVYWPKLQDSHKAYLKLRGMRYELAKYMHEKFRTDGRIKEKSLRRWLKSHNKPLVRNMSINDICNTVFKAKDLGIFNNHYESICHNCEEEFVYPEPVEC